MQGTEAYAASWSKGEFLTNHDIFPDEFQLWCYIFPDEILIKEPDSIASWHRAEGPFFFVVGPFGPAAFFISLSRGRVAAGVQQKPQKEPHMADKNTNPIGSKDDNEMRIHFGLILALCQNSAISHNPLFHAQNSNLIKGLV